MEGERGNPFKKATSASADTWVGSSPMSVWTPSLEAFVRLTPFLSSTHVHQISWGNQSLTGVCFGKRGTQIQPLLFRRRRRSTPSPKHFLQALLPCLTSLDQTKSGTANLLKFDLSWALSLANMKCPSVENICACFDLFSPLFSC